MEEDMDPVLARYVALKVFNNIYDRQSFYTVLSANMRASVLMERNDIFRFLDVLQYYQEEELQHPEYAVHYFTDAFYKEAVVYLCSGFKNRALVTDREFVEKNISTLIEMYNAHPKESRVAVELKKQTAKTLKKMKIHLNDEIDYS